MIEKKEGREWKNKNGQFDNFVSYRTKMLFQELIFSSLKLIRM